jgi:adenylate cyclase
LLDPNYAAAHAYAAWCHQQRFFRSGFHPEDRNAALKHAHIALSNGTDDPQALSIGAFVDAMITHDYESAIGVLDQALEMNGNSALALRFSSMMHAFSERYERASEHALRALRLSPFDPMNYHPYLALASVYLFTERFEEAVAYSTKAIQCNPGFSVMHAYLVVSNVNLVASTQRVQRPSGCWRLLRPSRLALSRMAFVRQALMDAFVQALQKAGLPE